MSDSLVIIPTFNEKENVEKIIRKIFSLEKIFHILIVDDSSPDGTPEIVKNLQIVFPDKLFLLSRTLKNGLGRAYIEGFKVALKKGYNYIFEMDADFSHNPNDLIRLYDACAVEGADLAIGSRYVKGGSVKNWPLNRLLLSYFASLYVRIILWVNIKDTTAGFKCYHRRVLEKINFETIKFVGYAFQIEMKYNVAQLGFKIKEVPIVFVDRIEGYSKMSTSIFKEALLGVLKMKFTKVYSIK